MKKLFVQFMFAMVIGVTMVSLSYATNLTESPTPKTVKGDLLKIDGEFYVVKDMAGKQIRLHADWTTVLDGAIKVGDKVEVQATESSRPYKTGFVDHAMLIKHVQPTK
jgi:membrane protein implicated in regulation of membrane protease activity